MWTPFGKAAGGASVLAVALRGAPGPTGENSHRIGAAPPSHSGSCARNLSRGAWAPAVGATARTHACVRSFSPVKSSEFFTAVYGTAVAYQKALTDADN